MIKLIKWVATILAAGLGIFIFCLPLILAYNGIQMENTEEMTVSCMGIGTLVGIAFPILIYHKFDDIEWEYEYKNHTFTYTYESEYEPLEFPVFKHEWMKYWLPDSLYEVYITQYLDKNNESEKALIKKLNKELMPALLHLSDAIEHNKKTRKMHKDIIPQIKDLHKKFKQIEKDLSTCDIDTKELIVQNLTDNIDDVVVYIKGIQKPFDEVIRYESDVKQAMKNLKKQNVDYFSDLRSYNSLSGSDIDELAEQYENMSVKKLKKINKKNAKKPSTKDESVRTSS